MLINCVAYKDGQKLAELELDQIIDYLKIPGSFVWVALRDASKEELLLMQHDSGPWLAVEDALHGNQRPKIQEYDDLIHSVMHLWSSTPPASFASARSMRTSARTSCFRCATAAPRACSACASVRNASPSS